MFRHTWYVILASWRTALINNACFIVHDTCALARTRPSRLIGHHMPCRFFLRRAPSTARALRPNAFLLSRQDQVHSATRIFSRGLTAHAGDSWHDTRAFWGSRRCFVAGAAAAAAAAAGSWASLAEPQSVEEVEPGVPAFDLRYAMLLAACSFEAYLDPEPPRSLQQIAPNGCAVTYMDKKFLQSSVLGLLRFEVLGTEKVPNPTTVRPRMER